MANRGNPLKLIGFAADDFYTLESESESFARWLDASNSPAELMAVLAPALRARVLADPPEVRFYGNCSLVSGLFPRLINARFLMMMPYGFGIRSRFRAILSQLVSQWIQSVLLPFPPGDPLRCFGSRVNSGNGVWSQMSVPL